MMKSIAFVASIALMLPGAVSAQTAPADTQPQVSQSDTELLSQQQPLSGPAAGLALLLVIGLGLSSGGGGSSTSTTGTGTGD